MTALLEYGPLVAAFVAGGLFVAVLLGLVCFLGDRVIDKEE